MKKNKTRLLFAVLMAIVFNFVSCQKPDRFDEIQADPMIKSALGKQGTQSVSDKQLIVDWLDLHNRNLNEKNKTTLKAVSSNLEYDKLSVVSRNNGENIIVIPLNETARKHLSSTADYLKLNGSAMSLVVIQGKQGKLRWSYIISHLPKEGNDLGGLSDITVQNIVNNKTVEEDGVYKFISLQGKLLFQQTYKKGRLTSFAMPSIKGANGTKKSGGRGTSGVGSTSNANCFDYYLVETWYNVDGSSYRIETFLGRVCDEEQEPGDGGGGGEVEEPIDHEVTISGYSETDETEYESDDYYYPTWEETILVNGEEVLPPPQLQGLKYYHHYLITKTPLIVATVVTILTFPPTVHPSDISFGGLRRVVTIYDVHSNSTHTQTTATMNWNYWVYSRYSTGGVQTRSSHRNKVHTKIVSI